VGGHDSEHEQTAHDLAFDAEEHRLVSASKDGGARVWDVATVELCTTLTPATCFL